MRVSSAKAASREVVVPKPNTIANDRPITIIFLNGVHRSFFIDSVPGTRAVEIDGERGNWNIYDSGGRRALALRSKEVGGTGAGLWIGANAADSAPGTRSPGPKAGFLSIRDNNGMDSIILNGSNNSAALKDTAGRNSIILDGRSGDIVLANADCAEDFDILHSTEMEPGTVMVIEQEGKLKECELPYDKRVAGVISGADNYKPGLLLDKRKSLENRKCISLMGKVFCKVDAQSAPIDVGDLLTTSYTKGHAMKAADPMKAFGSVIGKALKPLKHGRGMIPVLVALQ